MFVISKVLPSLFNSDFGIPAALGINALISLVFCFTLLPVFASKGTEARTRVDNMITV
jgi:hypothetical protein